MLWGHAGQTFAPGRLNELDIIVETPRNTGCVGHAEHSDPGNIHTSPARLKPGGRRALKNTSHKMGNPHYRLLSEL
jgi:hypothetical protein